MNTFAFLLLALVAAVSVQFSQAQAVKCFTHFTRAEAGKSGSQSFTGIITGPTEESYNNPVYYTLKAAQTGVNVTTNPAKGRFSGTIPVATFKGSMKFDFFKGKDQIVIDFTKSTGGGPIVSGKGCYAGIKGNANRTLMGVTLPKVFEWKFCPTKKPKCVPK
jgi:hypothetical protein